jgi:hypothetical protein
MYASVSGWNFRYPADYNIVMLFMPEGYEIYTTLSLCRRSKAVSAGCR